MNLEIALAADDNFAMQMGICIMSIVETNEEFFDMINIHILNNGISKDNIQKLKYLKKKYEKLNYFFYDVEFIKRVIPVPEKGNPFYHLGFSTYSRLFLAKLIDKSIKRILYLDSDILINGNLFDLYNVDFNDFYCAGVIDPFVKNIKNTLNMKENSIYINAGVLLINLEKWRSENIEDNFIQFFYNFPSKLINDQNIINKVFEEKIVPVDLKYNVSPIFFNINYKKFLEFNNFNESEIQEYYTSESFAIAVNNPIIIHFIGWVWCRPWEKRCNNPYTKKYLYYKDKSPWKHFELKKINILSKIRKLIIRKIFELLPGIITFHIFKIVQLLRY